MWFVTGLRNGLVVVGSCMVARISWRCSILRW